MPDQPNYDDIIKSLEEKYEKIDQDLDDHLEGLLQSKPITYWDYIHLDTLLSLQVPRTYFPDEEIFIMYHQITELYFKLAIHEFEQIGEAVKEESLTSKFLLERVKRINRYFTFYSL